jgi:hypothetical protein
MESYNSLFIDLDCPNCHETVDVEIKLRFGDVSHHTYVLGDYYNWLSNVPVYSGGRPEGGNMDGEGHVVCPQCGSIFKVTVEIREDIITRLVQKFAIEETSGVTGSASDLNNRMSMPAPRQGTIKNGNQWR